MIFPKPLGGASLLLLAVEASAAPSVQARARGGCGIVRDFQGKTLTNKTIVSGGITRTYDVYLPPDYDEVGTTAEPKK